MPPASAALLEEQSIGNDVGSWVEEQANTDYRRVTLSLVYSQRSGRILPPVSKSPALLEGYLASFCNDILRESGLPEEFSLTSLEVTYLHFCTDKVVPKTLNNFKFIARAIIERIMEPQTSNMLRKKPFIETLGEAPAESPAHEWGNIGQTLEFEIEATRPNEAINIRVWMLPRREAAGPHSGLQ